MITRDPAAWRPDHDEMKPISVQLERLFNLQQNYDATIATTSVAAWFPSDSDFTGDGGIRGHDLRHHNILNRAYRFPQSNAETSTRSSTT